ncbi:MAG: enoyl-CoA hydratase-related protein [Gemmatimonadales bacterium]|jgi:cyclohexa-1,5-dienecarbonyl-CoA hydratase
MTVKVTIADGIGTLTLADPPLNILTREVMGELRAKLRDLQQERALRVLLLSAEGKHFSAGADVGEHMPPEYEELIPEFIETITQLHEFPVPTVAAVRGRCLGGGFELIQAVDLVVAAESAVFGQPEILLGVLPPAACALLPELGTPAVAAEVVFTGDAIDAKRALAAGFAARVVGDDALDEQATALARQIARHSAAALRVTKKALRASGAERRHGALRTIGEIYVRELMQTEDALEGLTAFLEKRKAEWKHR